MTSNNTTTFERTTRWTAPEPEGLEKMFQDEWDAKRDTQVRTFMTYDTTTAFQNFCGAVKKGVDALVAAPTDKGTMVFVYGSYDRTDRLKKNGDENKAAEKEWDGNMRRLGKDQKLLLNRYLKSKGVVILKHGTRSTGTIHFTDGTMEVIDPTKGFQLNGEKTLKTIKPIETAYAVLMKKPDTITWSELGM